MDQELITEAYLATALWSSSCYGTADHDGCRGADCDTSLQDVGYTTGDLSTQAHEQATANVRDFLALLGRERVGYHDLTEEMMGHDFWLTRNRHGTGFWDRGLGELGDQLTKWAQTYGEADLYAGDDGEVYLT